MLVLRHLAVGLTGVPAGMFAPSLSIGAGIGNDGRCWPDWQGGGDPADRAGHGRLPAATTGGLITAFIIVMEMVSGQAMVLSLMACALLSSGVARLVTEPMYQELRTCCRCRPSPRRQKTSDPLDLRVWPARRDSNPDLPLRRQLLIQLSYGQQGRGF